MITRPKLSTAIRGVLDTTGATHITLTLSAANARVLCQDLDWAVKTTVRSYEADVTGCIADEKPVV